MRSANYFNSLWRKIHDAELPIGPTFGEFGIDVNNVCKYREGCIPNKWDLEKADDLAVFLRAKKRSKI